MGAMCAKETAVTTRHELTTEVYSSDVILKGLKIENLIEVKRDDLKNFEEEYLLKLLNFISRTQAKATKEVKRNAIEERRKLYRAGDWEDYESMIVEANEYEKSTSELVMREIFEALGFDEFDFISQIDALCEDEETRGRFEKAQ